MKGKLTLLLIALLGLSGSSMAQEGRTEWRGRGYAGFVDIGGIVGGEDELGGGIFSLTTTHGFQFKPSFFLGAGVGVENWTVTLTDAYGREKEYSKAFIPFYAALRWNFMNSRLTPFATLRVGGAAVDSPSEYQYGISPYFNAAIGFSAILRNDFGLNFSMGYNYLAIGSENTIYDPSYNFSGVSFKVGLEF